MATEVEILQLPTAEVIEAAEAAAAASAGVATTKAAAAEAARVAAVAAAASVPSEASLAATVTASVAAVIDPAGATVGQVATWDSAAGKFKPKPAPSTISGDMLLGIATALKNPYDSFGIQATGDSTTTPDTAWFRQFANEVAAAFPILTHHYRKWNDTTQNLDRPIVISTGAAGRRALLTDAGGTRPGVTFDGSQNIVGDFQFDINLKNPSWISGATQTLASKWTDDASASWVLMIAGTGTIRFQWSTNGSITWAGDRFSTVALPFANDTEGWIRVVLDVDNGASGNDTKFYTSTDGLTWTQLGTTVTVAGVTSIAASTSRYTLATRGTSSNPLTAGTRIYEVQIRDGINGGSVAPYLPDMWDRGIGTGVPTIEGAPVLTWIMSGHPGAGIGYDFQTTGYLADSARMKKMSPQFNQLAMFYNSSHNEYALHGFLWAQKYQAWVDGTSANKPLATRVALTQNPRTGAGAADTGPKQRRAGMLAWAQRAQGMRCIDTHQAFINDGRDLATVLISDGTHPTTAGYAVWKNAVMAELNASLARITAG